MRRGKQLQESIDSERNQGKLEEGGRIPSSREPSAMGELKSSCKGVKKCAEKCKHRDNRWNVVQHLPPGTEEWETCAGKCFVPS